MVPVNKLLPRLIFVRAVINPIVLGIAPVNKLSFILIRCTFDNDPIARGKVPPKLLWDMYI